MTTAPQTATNEGAFEVLLRPRLLLVTALVATMTFEDFILKWLPVSDGVYSASRFLSELFVYGMFVYAIGMRFVKSGKFRRTRIDIALLGFLAAAMVSIYINDAPLLGSLINLRVLVRYIALFYVVVNLDLTPREVRSMLMLIVAVGVFQSAIGLVQVFQGGPTPFWQPRASNLEVAGYSKEFTVLTGGIEKGAVVGAFGYSVAMALYLVLAIICALSLLLEGRAKSWSKAVFGYLGVALMLGCILLTYSRAAFAALILAIPVVLWFSRRIRTLLQAGLATAAVAAFLLGSFAVSGGPDTVGFVKVREQYVNPLQNIALVFSGEYWARAQGSRQWIIKEVGGNIVQQVSLFGFSPDEATAKSEIVQRAGGTLSKLITYRAFEDVYWVAMLAYYGFVGLGLYLYVLWILFRCALRRQHATVYPSRVASIAFSALIVITIPLTLIVQTFEFRAFGFYFWLLAALMYTEYEQAQAIRPAALATERSDGSSCRAVLRTL